MRHKFNYEETLKFIRENNIISPTQLRMGDLNLYNQLYKRNLLKEVFPEYRPRKTKEERYEEIRRFIEENGITTRNQLLKKNPNAYSYLYRHRMLDEVFPTAPGRKVSGERVKAGEGNGWKLKPLLIEYFYKWAAEEGKTLYREAVESGYGPQWVKYCEENGLDVNTGKRIENETEE